MNHKQETEGANVETSKANLSDVLLPERPRPLRLLKLHNQLGTKYSDTTQAEHGREGQGFGGLRHCRNRARQGLPIRAQRSEVRGGAGKGAGGTEPVWCQEPGR